MRVQVRPSNARREFAGISWSRLLVAYLAAVVVSALAGAGGVLTLARGGSDAVRPTDFLDLCVFAAAHAAPGVAVFGPIALYFLGRDGRAAKLTFACTGAVAGAITMAVLTGINTNASNPLIGVGAFAGLCGGLALRAVGRPIARTA